MAQRGSLDEARKLVSVVRLSYPDRFAQEKR
jgi:hypothetical protein